MASRKTNPNPSLHRRNDSGELDVFEASRYFSADFLQRSTARMSLDVPGGLRYPVHPTAIDPKGTTIIRGAKYKQPSSPGARLASFLNSLFSPTASKKKSKSSSSADEDRRKRRSSISHFVGIRSSRTADPAAITPTKSYKHKNFPERRHKVPGKDQRCATDQRSSISNADGDDGGDTDSSSDLFDLPSHELDFYSNGLPVYGTTNIDRIRIVAPISTITTVK